MASCAHLPCRPNQVTSLSHHVPDAHLKAWSKIQVPEYRLRTDPPWGLPSGAFPSELRKKSERALNIGERLMLKFRVMASWGRGGQAAGLVRPQSP